jgi:hypothetical protein
MYCIFQGGGEWLKFSRILYVHTYNLVLCSVDSTRRPFSLPPHLIQQSWSNILSKWAYTKIKSDCFSFLESETNEIRLELESNQKL